MDWCHECGFPQEPTRRAGSQPHRFIAGRIARRPGRRFAPETLEQDAELARLHERLKLTIELVRQATADAAAPPLAPAAPPWLTEDRRQKLLAQFKTVTPKEFAKPHRRRMRLEIRSAAAVLVALLALAVFQLSPGRPGPVAGTRKEPPVALTRNETTPRRLGFPMMVAARMQEAALRPYR